MCSTCALPGRPTYRLSHVSCSWCVTPLLTEVCITACISCTRCSSCWLPAGRCLSIYNMRCMPLHAMAGNCQPATPACITICMRHSMCSLCVRSKLRGTFWRPCRTTSALTNTSLAGWRQAQPIASTRRQPGGRACSLTEQQAVPQCHGRLLARVRSSHGARAGQAPTQESAEGQALLPQRHEPGHRGRSSDAPLEQGGERHL